MVVSSQQVGLVVDSSREKALQSFSARAGEVEAQGPASGAAQCIPGWQCFGVPADAEYGRGGRGEKLPTITPSDTLEPYDNCSEGM